MIAQPDAVTAEILATVAQTAAERRANPSVSPVRFERFAEGRCAQLLHAGPYGEAERPSIEALHRFIAESGLTERGRHHEIYLSDARRTAPNASAPSSATRSAEPCHPCHGSTEA